VRSAKYIDPDVRQAIHTPATIRRLDYDVRGRERCKQPFASAPDTRPIWRFEAWRSALHL